MKRSSRWAIIGFLGLATVSSLAAAQDSGGNNGDVNSKYQDALAQLKAAQDRKNELATENEKLAAHIADLERQLDDLQRDRATFAEQTWRFRMQIAAWNAFLERYPRLLERWKLFLERDPLAGPTTLPTLIDANDPLRSD